MDQEFKARAGSEREAYKSIVNQVHAYLRRTSRTRHYWEIQRTEWKPTELFGGGELKAHVWIKDSKMTKNSVMKFIDSCIGNIARKIEDEFNESDHPRGKGGKFTSKGGEGKGGAKKELVPETETEKAAKEELKGSTKSDEETLEGLDDYGQNLLDYCTDIDTANDALRALNWDTYDYDDLEQARTALKEAISQNPKAAKELWESTSNKEEIEEVRDGRETDEIVEEFKGSGIDMYAALADLGIDVQHTPEEYQIDAFKEALFNSPKFRKKAKEYIKQYRNTENEEEWFN